MTTITNGQQRKTLATQLDRLEAILDGLSQNLNGAVAGAVQHAVQQAVELAVTQTVGQAVQQAVQSVLAEVLANPVLQAAFTPPPAPDHPGRGGLAQGLSRAWAWTRGQLAAGVRLARRGACALWQRVGALGAVKGPLAVAGGVGALAAAVYYGGPLLAGLWGCATGLVMAQLASTRAALRRLLSLNAATT